MPNHLCMVSKIAAAIIIISTCLLSTFTIVPVNCGMIVAPNSKSAGLNPVKVMVKVSSDSSATPSVTNRKLMLVSIRCSSGNTNGGANKVTSLSPAGTIKSSQSRYPSQNKVNQW